MAATMVIPPSETGPVRLTSSAGLLAMLEEQENEIKAHALAKLNSVVADFWAEISESLPDIESLYEDDDFPQRKLAALVASKVYYYLGELGDALTYALSAAELFNVEEGSEYVETLLAKGVDEYCETHVKRSEQLAAKPEIEPEAVVDSRLQHLVERLVESSLKRRAYLPVMGIALEARRLDIIERVVKMCGTEPGDNEHESSTPAMLSYCLTLCSTISEPSFRKDVLRVLVKTYNSLTIPDYVGLCRCLALLNDGAGIAATIEPLLGGSRESVLIAFQVAFDLVENCSQLFLKLVAQPLLKATPEAAPEAVSVAATGADAAEAAVAVPKINEAHAKARASLLSILSGEVPISITLEFLCRANKTDLAILTSVKKAVDQRNSLCHSAIVLAHAIMSSGTTSDSFLRQNLDWLSRATNWAKFSATATLGVIHKGHVKQAQQLLAPYLPQQNMSASPFSEGGALYALGIIHANHGSGIRSYLLNALKNAGTNEVVQHGAALGIGIAAMATEDDELYEELKGVLFNDSAVAGEAAAIGMGLVMLGSASPKAVEEMLGYAHDTQHEKIIRGLAMGIAMCMYGRESDADSLVTTLLHDQDAILRYSAMYTLAFAYAGTGSNSALRRLLHVAVSDVSDDVRRAAVTAIGFVLCGTPAQCPKVVKLLAESFNPHVRYGATLAVGISCAGTSHKEALELLHPMLSDPIDYVRQGALLATSMVLMQNSNHEEGSKLSEHRKLLHKVVSDKHEDTMAKFGAILATGVLDAGGRNVTISLISKTGQKMMGGIVGMAVFSHFWFWHPLSLFMSLAFSPTAAIGLNADLKMPVWRFKSRAPASTYAYPPLMSSGKKVEGPKAVTAVLSTTTKVGKRAEKLKDGPTAGELEKSKKENAEKWAAQVTAARKAVLASLAELEKQRSVSKELHEQLASAAKSEAAPMEDESKAAASSELSGFVEALQEAHLRGELSTVAYNQVRTHVPTKPAEDGKEEAKPAPEPDFETLENPARVLRSQERLISLLPGSRYVPVTPGRCAGIIMLSDQSPEEQEEVLIASAMEGDAPAASDEEEPSPPAPFQFTE